MKLHLALLLAPLVTGCRTLDLAIWNVRELHQPTGRPERVGRVLSPWEGILLAFAEGLQFGNTTVGFASLDDRAIEDPLGECLIQLISLSELDPDDERTAAYQAEFFSWLAVDDVSSLSRERSVMGLEIVGRAMGAEGPRVLAPDATPLDARAVAELLRQLLAVSAAPIEGAPTEEEAAAFADACAAVRAAPLDREGARRLLSAVNVLRERAGFDAPALEAGHELGRHLALLSVELALGEALGDVEERVRATALEASVALSGNTLPGLLEAALLEVEGAVAVRAALLLERYGLPRAPSEAIEANAWSDGWTSRLVAFTTATTDGQAAIAGCRALARVSGRDSASLRPEDWGRWWRERNESGSAAP